MSELVQRATLAGPATACRWRRAGEAVRTGVSLAGEPTPAPLPAMREALLDGAVGVDGLLAVADPLRRMSSRVAPADVRTADDILAAEARGAGPDGAPPACADLLRIQACAWATALDQDGAEPRDERALRLRGLSFGAERDGLVSVSGALLTEVAAQFQRLHDAIASPRTPSPRFRTEGEALGVDGLADVRAAAQKRHDTLATALTTAAASGVLPAVGGAAPTLIVSVREEDLRSGRGWAHIDGAERVFNRHQRRAIALRDGGCVIPGCGVAAGWCEIHHVTEHARGGPTHTDNGVLVCWFHHRTLEKSGWRIRMNRGVPGVLAPVWVEADPRWRPCTTSPTQLLDAVRLRT